MSNKKRSASPTIWLASVAFLFVYVLFFVMQTMTRPQEQSQEALADETSLASLASGIDVAPPQE
jgi:hypothetical protein